MHFQLVHAKHLVNLMSAKECGQGLSVAARPEEGFSMQQDVREKLSEDLTTLLI